MFCQLLNLRPTQSCSYNHCTGARARLELLHVHVQCHVVKRSTLNLGTTAQFSGQYLWSPLHQDGYKTPSLKTRMITDTFSVQDTLYCHCAHTLYTYSRWKLRRLIFHSRSKPTETNQPPNQPSGYLGTPGYIQKKDHWCLAWRASTSSKSCMYTQTCTKLPQETGQLFSKCPPRGMPTTIHHYMYPSTRQWLTTPPTLSNQD